MTFLSHLRLRTKLFLILGLFALALTVECGVSASILHQRMLDDRVDKLQSLVLTVRGFAETLEQQVQAGRLTRDQAMASLRDQLHHVRYGTKDDYFLAQTYDGMVVMHGGTVKREGKPTTAKNSQGRNSAQLAGDVLRNTDGGVITYDVAKPGNANKEPKLSYVGRFAPWQIDFITGSWTDDIDAAYRAEVWRLTGIGGALLLATVLTAWLINHDIVHSLGALKTAMGRLSEGALDTAIPGADRGDEVGTMAGIVLIFRQSMQQAEHLAAAQQEDHAQAAIAKRDALVGMAETIETRARDSMVEVGNRTGAMTRTAHSMSESATRTGTSAEGAATAAGQALANAQTVASAAEQLSASIREISSQVSQSAQIVERAVGAGRNTRETMQTLNEQVARIGSVADMIGEIAAKTNLLALNATIEAARAGDAGKGFAVVASEVKQLATQTARSTEEISRHIAEVRSATGASVAAVSEIEQTIGEVNAIAGSIAAAVERQGTATAEIARNVAETAAAASAMTLRIDEVTAEAEQTGQHAAEVLENTARLDEAVRHLQHAVIHVVRTATEEADRRKFRRRPCLVEARVDCNGASVTASIHDISEAGCLAAMTLPGDSGQAVTLELARFGVRLQGTVVAQVPEGLHIAFLGTDLSAADADRISRTTIQDLVGKAKDAHHAFVARVVDAVDRHELLSPDALASHHECMLGRWYDSVSDPATLRLPAFIALADPHDDVHLAGRHALAAMAASDMPAVQRHVADLRHQSALVVQFLEQFGREYPDTLAAATAAAPAALAA